MKITADQNDQIIKELGNVKVDVENVKLQVEDFNSQVSAGMFKLCKALDKVEDFKKAESYSCGCTMGFTCLDGKPESYSCGCTMGFTCLHGKPVSGTSVTRAMVTVNTDINDVNAGDTGVGYYTPDGRYNIIWKNAGYRSYDCNNISAAIVYKCDAKV